MISVARQLPRNSSTIRRGQAAAITASRSTPCTEARTNSDWSATGSIFSDAGTRPRSVGIIVLMRVDDVERRGVAALVDREQRGARPFEAHDIGLRLEAVAHVGDVA